MKKSKKSKKWKDNINKIGVKAKTMQKLKGMLSKSYARSDIMLNKSFTEKKITP